MRLILTRPRADSEPLAVALRAAGHWIHIEPMMEIVAVAEADPDLEGVQALLFTSANGVRAFAVRLSARALPAFAVGAATGEAARAAGFSDVQVAGGDVEALADLVSTQADPGRGALLHIAGSHRAGDLAGRLTDAGFEIHRSVLYEAKAVETLSDAGRKALQEGVKGVLFFSPRTAALFVDRVREAGLEAALESAVAYCLSPAVAEAAAALPWKTKAIAPRPETTRLLALIGG